MNADLELAQLDGCEVEGELVATHQQARGADRRRPTPERDWTPLYLPAAKSASF